MNQNWIQEYIFGDMYTSSSTVTPARHAQLGEKVAQNWSPIQIKWDIVHQIKGENKLNDMSVKRSLTIAMINQPNFMIIISLIRTQTINRK